MIVLDTGVLTSKSFFHLLKEGGFIRIGKFGIKINKTKHWTYEISIVATGQELNNTVYFKNTYTKIERKVIKKATPKIDKIVEGKSTIAKKQKGSMF